MNRDINNYHILVIEDNTGDYTLVEDFLGEQIMAPQIVHANSFREAESILSASGPGFDVILLDLTLPDKSGQQLINDIKNVASLCPIIILTGYADIDFSIRSIAHNISDYLLKEDLSAPALYKSIVYAIERNKGMSELINSEKRYSNLFHLSPQPMLVYDPVTLKFIQVNNSAIEKYGYSEEEFLDMTFQEINAKDGFCETRKNPDPILATAGIAFTGESRHCKKSGEIMEVDITSNFVRIDNLNYVLIIVQDITEKKLHENRIIQAILRTQEEERFEISAELHDNVCQLLAASQMSLDKLKNELPASAVKWYDSCREHLLMALDEIRNITHHLAPAFFDNTTLEEAFSRLLNSLNVEGKYKMLLSVDNSVNQSQVGLDIQLNLYRILQEQLSNIVKYAHADQIKVEVYARENILVMRIQDNGVGFDIKNARSKEGIGLANIKKRAKLLSGNAAIISLPGGGCSVIIEIPMG